MVLIVLILYSNFGPMCIQLHDLPFDEGIEIDSEYKSKWTR